MSCDDKNDDDLTLIQTSSGFYVPPVLTNKVRKKEKMNKCMAEI